MANVMARQSSHPVLEELASRLETQWQRAEEELNLAESALQRLPVTEPAWVHAKSQVEALGIRVQMLHSVLHLLSSPGG